MKDSGWNFDKNNTMMVIFRLTTESNGSNFVKIPIRSSAILIIENDKKYCIFRSKLASLYPCENTNPKRVSNIKHYFIQLNFEQSDCSKRYKSSDNHRF